MKRVITAMFCAIATLTACGSADERTCTVNADCASGICGGDGQCAAADAGSVDGGIQSRFADGSAGVDAGGDLDLMCKPNHDGSIDRAEAPYGPGLNATFRIATDVTVDSAGTLQADGSRVWSFEAALKGDHDAKIQTLAVADSWFLKHFPGATYASQMDESQPLLGVFQLTAKALLLRGVVSPEEGLLATRLSYDPPVEILSFPLVAGAKWSRTTSITGFAQGILAAYSETYSSEVDGHGIAKTPFGNFPVLRVSTLLQRQVGLMKTTVYSRLFAAECFGTVASLRSQSGETAKDFTDAAEIRRLTP